MAFVAKRQCLTRDIIDGIRMDKGKLEQRKAEVSKTESFAGHGDELRPFKSNFHVLISGPDRHMSRSGRTEYFALNYS